MEDTDSSVKFSTAGARVPLSPDSPDVSSPVKVLPANFETFPLFAALIVTHATLKSLFPWQLQTHIP